MHINCTKNDEILDGKLHFLCSDKSAAYLKKHVVLQSSKHEELTFACTFIFAFIPHFIGGNIVKKYCQKCAVGGCKKPYRGVVYRKGVQS